MTSIPKPLKFLRSHYQTIKDIHEAAPAGENKTMLADVISVRARDAPRPGRARRAPAAPRRASRAPPRRGGTGPVGRSASPGRGPSDTTAPPRSAQVLAIAYEDSVKDSLKYKLMGCQTDIGTWGNEYLRSLAGQLGIEYQRRVEGDEDTAELIELVKQIVPYVRRRCPRSRTGALAHSLTDSLARSRRYHVEHNAEPEAIDILIEVDHLHMLEAHVDKHNYERTCLYLTSCSSYLPEPDDKNALKVAFEIYMKVSKHADALRTALRMNDMDLVVRAFSSCSDKLEKRQLGFLLGKQGVVLDLEEGAAAVPEEDREPLLEAISNSKLNEYFLSLAKDLDLMDPKVPEDIYKTHLLEGRAATAATMDSARANLASTFVNGFVNAAYGKDKLLISPSDEQTVNWIFKNKEHGKMSAAASLGLMAMWDVEGGLAQVDKYLYAHDSHVVAGALLAVGIISAGVRNECDPAFALLENSVRKEEEHSKRLGAIMGLGLAYAGATKREVLDLLSEIILEEESNMEIVGYTALSIGLVYVGTCDPEAIQTILTVFMQRSEMEMGEFWARFLCLGLGLLFLGRGDIVDPTVEIAKTFAPRVSKFCQVALESCAYAGTGDVLKVQSLLAVCGEHNEKTEEDKFVDVHQEMACIGIAMVAMGEELGSEMVLRTMEHMLQYADQPVRKCVPLALALLSISNPQLSVVDTLSRLTHDSNSETAQAAILAMGVVGAGTNNARLASILRALTSYYYTEPSALFCVKVAQGLVHMGKGVMTLSPFHTHKQLMSNMSLAGILPVLLCCTDLRATLLGKHHFNLYYIAAAIQPRMLMTLDEEGKVLPVAVRVGQAVDVVGQAGKPKTITGFQTHTTPVLLGAGERAELATDKYIALTPILEGLVLLKENPDYEDAPER